MLLPPYLGFEFTAPLSDCGMCRSLDPYHFLQISGNFQCLLTEVPAGSPSRGEDVTVYAFDVN